MKKLTAIVITLILMISTMAGCTGETSDTVSEVVNMAVLNGPTGMATVTMLDMEDKYDITTYQAPTEDVYKRQSQAIVELLRKNGIETEYPFAGFETGFCGKINPEKEKRAVILAEYDALQGMGHACGHCASGSSSVWAALALNEMRDELDFGIDIIGTPDEERRGCLLYTSRCV